MMPRLDYVPALTPRQNLLSTVRSVVNVFFNVFVVVVDSSSSTE